MNTKLIKFLAFANLSLGLLIAGEWLYAGQKRQHLLEALSFAKPENDTGASLPEMTLKKQAEDSYSDLVTRPLFIKGRRPVDEPKTEAEQASAKADDFDWQLTGIYGDQNTVSALFSRTKLTSGKGNHKKLSIGDDIDGWKLIDIKPDQVLLRLGYKEKLLSLRKPKLKVLPQPSAPLEQKKAAGAAFEPVEENTSETNP